jgi:uncharacterized protein (DUF2252 family)
MTLPLTAQERFALGQKKRKQLPRTSHAAWKVAARKETASQLLDHSEKGRIPALVKLKHERMAVSPFGYFRGAVPVMAYDLSMMSNTGIATQLCGDAHVRNLGAFAGPDGRLVFDINDFDETIAGPFEWDVKRMATSLILAGREGGTKDMHCREAAGTFLERYTSMMRAFARMPVLEVAKYQVHRLQNVAPLQEIMELAQRATPLSSLEALTKEVSKPGKESARKKSASVVFAHTEEQGLAESETSGRRIFRTQEPILERLTGSIAQQVIDSLTLYAETLQIERRRFLAQYRVIDVAFKVVGTGSVGLRDYCIYMEGNGPKDPLFLQIKEETHSAYAPYLGDASEALQPSHQGRRVVYGERAMQLQSDPFLGWTTIDGRDYLVRQLNDHKASIDLTHLRAAGLLEYAAVCGEMLARGHARGGDCSMLAGYIGNSGRFEQAVEEFSIHYADQTEKDWKALVSSDS